MLASNFSRAAVLVAFVATLATSASAEIVFGVGSGATVSVSSGVAQNFAGFAANPYAASLATDQLTSASSSIAFVSSGSPDFVQAYAGDRLILAVVNDTGHSLSNFVFTLSGLSGPQFYIFSDTPTFGIPSAGTYVGPYSGPGTYTTATSLVGDLSGGNTVLSVPLTLGAGQEQDFYFALYYTTAGVGGNFTLSQQATEAAPEPSFYSLFGTLAAGLLGMLLVLRLRKTA